MTAPLGSIPNLLSLSRVPIAMLVFCCVAQRWWAIALGLFVLAAVTDWLDGWWARRFQQTSAVGRALDPLTDKVLLVGTFVFLQDIPETGILPWMTALLVCRELLVTGIRGMVESAGGSFPADRYGKLKTFLQFVVILLIFAERLGPETSPLVPVRQGVLLSMLFVTAFSGCNYLLKGVRQLREKMGGS